MKARVFVLLVILLFVAQGFAFANRQLDRTEILQIFQVLTNQPRRTWIPSGTIDAAHLAYSSSSGCVTTSTVIVKYDGERFYWEINIDSRTKAAESQSETSCSDFDLGWNERRVFAWDGQQYTTYFRPANRAIVAESPNDIPIVVTGPLTAGIVPWGYGVFTYEELSAAESSAFETEIDGIKQVHLTLRNTNTPEMVFVLDPAKNYAVLSCSFDYAGYPSSVKTYGDYELVAGSWIPTTILIERYDGGKQPPELLSSDYWNLISIDVRLPQPDSFRVTYDPDALVEYDSPVAERHLFYRYSNEVDTDSLLQDRIAILSAGDPQSQNCATAAVKYVSEQLGRQATEQELTQLAGEPNKGTSLYKLRQFAQQLGFHCLAVKADIQTLRNLKNCRAILHLTGADHYVVLGAIDDEYIRLIDLDSNKFYYRTSLDEFSRLWSEGTALLISDGPLALTGSFTELSGDRLHEIIGSLTIPDYSCTDLIQTYNIIFCSEMIGGICGSTYTTFYNRYGCEEDENGGNCTGTDLVGNVWCVCIEDMDNPGICIVSGVWHSQCMRACQ